MPYARLTLCLCCMLVVACQPKAPESKSSDNTTSESNLAESNSPQSNQAANTTQAKIEFIASELSPVSIGNLPQQFEFTGTVQAQQQTSIQSQVSATAQQVNADVGQTVAKNQVLLVLNNQDNSARLAQARANLLAAQAQANQAERVMQRKQRLLDQGFIAKVEFEQSQVDYQNQRESVRAQQANVDIASKAAQDGIIRSPINGVIAKRHVDAGQVVSIGQTLFDIVNPAQLEIKAQAPTEAQNALTVGQSLQFQLQSNPQNYSAKIVRVAPVADLSNRQIEFYAVPEQRLASLSIGGYVQGQLKTQSALTGQRIALDRIQNLDAAPYVWLVRNGKLLKVNIKVLAQDAAQNLALVQGLQAGDRISQVAFNDQDQNKTVTVSTP